MSLNRVTHFEIPGDDPEKLMNFFSEVFQWKFEQFGENNFWFAVTGDGEEGINGGIIKKKEPTQSVLNSILVEDIDEVARKIENAGGEIVVNKMEIESYGWLAYFKDPEGNIHGLWQDINQSR